MDLSDLPEQVNWPPPPAGGGDQANLAQIHYQAQIDEVKARYQAQIDEVKASWRDRAAHEAEEWKLTEARRDGRIAAEDALRAAVQSAYLEVAKGTLDRALKRAEFLTAAAGAIGTSYAALLGLVYSASADTPNPLPAAGIGPALFLGLAFVLSAFYISYIRVGISTGRALPAGLGVEMQEERLLFFIKWITDSALERAWALRTAIVSLGIGVALTPLPFLQLDETTRWQLIGAGAVLFVIVLVYQLVRPARSG